MAFTTNKKLSAQAAASASGTWGAGGTTGVDLNTGVIGPLDTILAGISTFSVASSNVSLTFTAGGGGDVSNCMWRFTGVLLQNIVVSPTAGDATTYLLGFYYFENLTTGSFTITLTTGTGSVVLPQSRRGCVFIDGTNAPRIVALVGSSAADPVPTGSKTIWYNTAAPSGWTAVALNDYAIKIVTAGLGGVTSGSVAYATLYARTATDSHALTTAELASHTHTVASTTVSRASGSDSFTALTGASTVTSGASGSGDGHTHNIDMRVLTAAFSLCAKD